MASSVALGALKPWSATGQSNTLSFLIQQALSKLHVVTLVQVQDCSNDGDVSAVGTVTVLPLVNQLDGQGNPTPHVNVFGLPYLRMQGGTSAVIMDPQPGDIGVAVFASRDISKVKSTRAQANPGSNRKYSLADGIYLGTVMCATAPQQYVQFNDDGITIATPDSVAIAASGNLTLSGQSIHAGASPVPVCSKPLVTWINSTLLPALAAKGITVSAPSANALTTTFEAS